MIDLGAWTPTPSAALGVLLVAMGVAFLLTGVVLPILT
jgi:hypothetical protein